MQNHMQQPRGSFRDNQSFWLGFTAIVLLGLLVVLLTWLTAGTATASFLLSAGLAASLGIGIR